VKRWAMSLVGLGIAFSFQAVAPAHADRITTTINVGDAYHGSVTFRSAPDLMLIPNTDVYTIRTSTDYDLYRYDGWYYLVDNDAWYRARSWRGPFTYIRRTTVPQPVIAVPTTYRRTWTIDTGSDRMDDRYTDRASDNDRYTDRYRNEPRVVVRPGQRYRGVHLTFRTAPQLVRIPRSRVFYVRNYDRDLYRYGTRWYYVENGVWYASDSWRGPFFSLRFGDVPLYVRQVPTRYRRTWTLAGVRDDRTENRTVVRIGERADFMLDTAPRMAIIPNSDVYYLRDEADYDLYRYGNSWYLVDDGYWYRANTWRGPFLRIRTGSVPSAVMRIPSGYRKTWVPSMD